MLRCVLRCVEEHVLCIYNLCFVLTQVPNLFPAQPRLPHSAHGLVLDVGHFIAQQRSERQRNFLRLFRHSQMFHMWAVERLQLAASAYNTPDAFERKVHMLWVYVSTRLHCK